MSEPFQGRLQISKPRFRYLVSSNLQALDLTHTPKTFLNTSSPVSSSFINHKCVTSYFERGRGAAGGEDILPKFLTRKKIKKNNPRTLFSQTFKILNLDYYLILPLFVLSRLPFLKSRGRMGEGSTLVLQHSFNIHSL